MDLVSEIKRLTGERGTLLARVAEIDRDLAQVREFLSPARKTTAVVYKRPARGHRPVRTAVAQEGSVTRDSIYAALAVKEPQTVEMLKAVCHTTTIGMTVGVMVTEGRLVRRRFGSLAYWYARTADAFAGFEPPHLAASSSNGGASDDELGRPVQATEEDGSTPDTDSVLA